MIKIRKTEKPRKLAENGAAKTIHHCTEYDSEPEKYRSGQKKMVIDRNIYGGECVREILKQSHFDKCCYCESRFSGTSFGHVEHFRPKGGVKQSLGASMEYPGYYWLAYSWENLYYSCQVCNHNKGTLFPLVDDIKRARSHHDDIDLEHPLLVDPGGAEDPRNHIGFHREVPVKKSEKGRVTIETLRLKRPKLDEDRRVRLAELKHALYIVKSFPLLLADNPDALQVRQEAEDLLDSAVKACAKFSSMAQDLLAEER